MELLIVSKISVVSLVSDEIISSLVFEISVVSDKTIFYAVSKISVVSLVSDEIISSLVFEISVVSIVSD